VGALVRTGAGPVASISGCWLANGIRYVIYIQFDNVHFARDEPDIPSDLEQMPHLFDFLRANATVLAESHTPLIAHTAGTVPLALRKSKRCGICSRSDGTSDSS